MEALPLQSMELQRTGQLTAWPAGFFDQAQVDLAALWPPSGDATRDRPVRTRRVVVGGRDRGRYAEVLSNAIQHLLERLDVARERNEGVVRHADYYETALDDGVQLYSALFEPGCPVRNSIDDLATAAQFGSRPSQLSSTILS